MKNNLIKFGGRLLWERLTGKNCPFLVQLNITNRCNCACNYCYARYYSRPREDMTLLQMKNIIDSLAEAGTFRINLLGGEPLLRNDIGQIIDYVQGKGIVCAMTTNGTLVPERIDIVKKLDLVSFSIDGRKQGNDLNRGQGLFQKAVSGITSCRQAGIKFQISSVLTKHTVNDVDYLISMAEEYNCLIGFTTLSSQKRENNQHEHNMFPDEHELRGALLKIIHASKKGKPVLFSPQTYEYSLQWKDYRDDIIIGRKPDFKNIKCLAGKYFCLIDYNSDMYPCPRLIGIVKPGNILRDGFMSAFKKAVEHNCMACSSPCSNDFSMFFSLNPKVLWTHFCSLWR